MAVKPTIQKRTPIVIYAGTHTDIDAIYEQMRVFHLSYVIRLVVYAFFEAGNVEPHIDWSAYGEKPLCDDRQLLDLMCGISHQRKLPVQLLALFLSDGRNVKSLVDRLSDEERKLWRKCLLKGSVMESEVRALMKIAGSERVFIDKARFSWLYPTPVSIQNVRWCWSSTKPELEFVIDSLLRPYLVAFFFPDAADFPVYDTIPEELTVFSDEDGALASMMRYEGLVAANVLSFASDSYLTMLVIRRVAAALELKEFFPDSGRKYQKNARARILLNMMCVLRNVSTLSTMTASERCGYVLRQLCKDMPVFVRHALMPQLRGKFAGTPFDIAAFNAVIGILRMLRNHSGNGKWVEVKSLIDYMRLLYGSGSDLLLLDSYSSDRAELSVKSDLKNASIHRIAIDERFDYLIIPLVNATLFMLAALGGLEVAYSDRISLNCSPYSGLVYWRVTGLGRYLLGITDRYERNIEIASTNDFVLDERHLIIGITNTDSSMRGVLTRIAKPVSTTRYAVNAETFLRECNDRKDILRNIELVRNFICPSPPAIWESFFKEMLSHAEAVCVDNEKYVVFKVDAADKALQQYLATDIAMREIVICAQGFRVLVRVDDVARFKSLLLARGYLL